MSLFIRIYLPFQIESLYVKYLMFKKKKFQDNTEQIKIIQHYFTENYNLLNNKKFGPYYDEYFDSCSDNKKIIIKEWDINFFSYRNIKYVNTYTKNLITNDVSLIERKSKKRRLLYYEFTLNIHVELIKQIESSFSKLNEYYDFLVIYIPEQVNESGEDNTFLPYLYHMFSYSILIIGENLKIYFRFSSENIFYDDSWVFPRMVVVEFFLCIKKNKYNAFYTYFHNLAKINNFPLNFEIKQLKNNVDYFTRKNFYNRFSYEIDILGYEIKSMEQNFDIFNYSSYLDIYYELGFYLNLTALNFKYYPEHKIIKNNYIIRLNEKYNCTKYLYEKYNYYKTVKLRKHTRLFIKFENKLIYMPNVYKGYYIKFFGNFITKKDKTINFFVNRIQYYMKNDEHYDFTKYYFRYFSFLIIYLSVTILYNVYA